jgi:hypothetical protein
MIVSKSCTSQIVAASSLRTEFGWGASFLLWIKIEQALMVYANSMKLNLQDFAEAGARSARR